MAVSREVIQSPLYQGVDEQIYYSITTTPWGSTPTSIAVVAYDEADESNVSATVLSGSASATGDVITLPIVKALTVLHNYRIEVKFTTSAVNIVEAYFRLLCR